MNEPMKIILLMVIALLLAGCQVGPVKLIVESPTPGGETALSYQAPVALTIEAGDTVPGTDIRYVGQSDDRAELLIGDQTAFKQVADSVDWSGSPVTDVDLDLRSRIARFNEQELNIGGTASIAIQEPVPEAGAFPESAPIEYRAPVVYSVPVGDQIPGSLIAYEGVTDQGAELSGVEGYPYRKKIDSIVWEGTLKENVYLRLDLRVIRFTEEALNVTGLATIGIEP